MKDLVPLLLAGLAAGCSAGAGGSKDAGLPEAAAVECEDGEVDECHAGDDSTEAVGACTAGVSICADGAWSPCEGAVLPANEVCDGQDNDCDGEVDDGVLSGCGVCGVCGSRCFGVGEACEPWRADEPGFTRIDGALLPVVDVSPAVLDVVWIPSIWDGSIFRIDATTRQVEAAFWTGSDPGVDGDRPSRVLVDLHGAAIVCNEHDDPHGLASITKIAADPEACVDRNGDGRIQTSTGWNDKLAFWGLDDWADECILWHTELGDQSATALALVEVAAGERGWVGIQSSFLEFDASTGELTGVEALTGDLRPIDAAVDREGWIWFAAYDAVGRFDALDPDHPVETMGASFGREDVMNVMVDESDVPWAGGSDVWRWDAVQQAFVSARLQRGWAWGFGLSPATDGHGAVWVGARGDAAELYRITNDAEMAVDVFPLEQGGHFGVSVDASGRVWAVPGNPGGAVTSVLDPATGSIETCLDDCDGQPCINVNMTPGDFTSLPFWNLRNPQPELRRVVTSCEGEDGEETAWGSVTLDADVPAGNDLHLQARTASSVDGLGGASWLDLGHMPEDGLVFDLGATLRMAGVESARVLELRLIERRLNPAALPAIRSVTVDWGCALPFI